MGLDAFVFCDCVEEGRLKSPHPFPNLLYIAPNGSPEIRSRSNARREQHDDWMEKACKHPDMFLAGGQLGSIGGIDFVGETLKRAVRRPSQQFPVLCEKVIFSGAHCGDHLNLKDVRLLDDELRRLREVDFARLSLKPEDASYLEEFQETLSSIVKTALRVKKPVAF